MTLRLRGQMYPLYSLVSLYSKFSLLWLALRQAIFELQAILRNVHGINPPPQKKRNDLKSCEFNVLYICSISAAESELPPPLPSLKLRFILYPAVF